MTAIEARAFLPPDLYEMRWYADNLADHADHDLVAWQQGTESYRVVIERSSLRFHDEEDYRPIAIKSVGSNVEREGFVCLTCNLDLDVPQTMEWAL